MAEQTTIEQMIDALVNAAIDFGYYTGQRQAEAEAVLTEARAQLAAMLPSALPVPAFLVELDADREPRYRWAWNGRKWRALDLPVCVEVDSLTDDGRALAPLIVPDDQLSLFDDPLLAAAVDMGADVRRHHDDQP